MPNSDESSPPSSQRRRSHLPPLAPRNAQTSSRGERSASSSGRPPRLSHRSRAGCWTCRGRKVKCDEIHPKCGPCTRLNKPCDWDHRWNFSDATANTQSKYTNVTTQGNAVWDSTARSSPSNSPIARYDDMPAFSVLQTDDERERKAETQRPGTFGVVVTPDSFSELPEYAATVSPSSRRMSVQSQGSLFGHAASLRRSSTQPDPNTVVLERFEDASPGTGSPFTISPDHRRPSLPESMYYLAITTTPPGPAQTIAVAPTPQPAGPAGNFIASFRQYIVQRLCQPMTAEAGHALIVPGSTKDMFEIEGQRFAPLHHAICAISSLNLSYGGKSTLGDAMDHYQSALSAGTAQDDLLSDGGFLRHFLLLVYDICIPMNDDSNMWAEHLGHLKRIALARHEQLGRESRGFVIWRACELDTNACLMGHGSCEFVRHVLENNMLPSLEQQIPIVNPAAPFAANEAPVFPTILALRRNVLVFTAKLAQLAQTLRTEAFSRRAMSPGAYARWQAVIASAQAELTTSWMQGYPDFLPPESPEAGRGLPYRVRYVFEQAYLLYQAAMIYSRTSMFPRQRGSSSAHAHDTQADTERRVLSIITVAEATLAARNFAARHVVFPLFLAGCTTAHPDSKIKALDLVAAFEATGIGKNTSRTRSLLKAVYDEQREAYGAGGNPTDVDWLTVARERNLMVVNCGL